MPSESTVTHNPRQNLLSRFVFIDSEAYISSGYDFSGGVLGKLVELAKLGLLRVLITDVTRREVIRNLHQRIDGAVSNCRKDWNLLKQGRAVQGPPPSTEEVMRHSQEAFDHFLSSTCSILVPLDVHVPSLLDDYFNFRPPFSRRKQREFPDAIVAASLLRWCEQSNQAIYVVSGDRDFDEVCESVPCFFKVDKIAEVLTHASVSEETYRYLAATLSESDELAMMLVQELLGRRAESTGASRTYMPGPVSAEGYVRDARIDQIEHVDVLDTEGGRYRCLVTFSADVVLHLEVTDLNWDSVNVVRHSMKQRFGGEVVVSLESEAITIDSVAVDEDMINLDDEIDNLS